jgi:hypothetical protein
MKLIVADLTSIKNCCCPVKDIPIIAIPFKEGS